MTPADADPPPLRPPPATGRQDRRGRTHEDPPSRRPEPVEEQDEHLAYAPRGLSYYQEGRQTSYGFGCLVVAGLGGVAAAAILVALAFMPMDDGIGVIHPAPGGGQQEQQPQQPPQQQPAPSEPGEN